MAIEVFNRYEKKYFLTQAQFDHMYSIIKEHMNSDKHNNETKGYCIYNIYYDTYDNYLIRNSLSKPTYKEKLRLRSYTIPKEDDIVYLEIKKKVNKLVNKRRTALKLGEAYEFLQTKKAPKIKDYMNPQVICELEYFLNCYKLRADTYLAYDRIAFFEKENNDLRISFDKNIRSRKSDLKLELGDGGKLLLDDNSLRLMEIKTSRAMPLWLCRALSECEIKPSGFSKYGKSYLNNIKKEDYSCNQYQIYFPQLHHQSLPLQVQL